MTRRVSGASVVAACLFVAALGTSPGRAELNVWVTPSSANYDVMLPGDTWMGSGTIWGWGDGIVCYEWKFSDNDERIGGYILAQGRIEFSTPLVSHTFANVGHFEVTLSAWWQDQGRGAETVNGRDVWVVQLDISSDTRLTAATAPDSRSELGIGEITDCTLAVLPADTPLNVWWTVNGAGKPGPAPPGLPTDLAYPVTAKLQPGQCTVTASIGRAYAQREFTVIEPTDMGFWLDHDTAPGTYGADNFMGCQSHFGYAVYGAAVSFANVQFRENKPDLDFDWPDGTHFHEAPQNPFPGWRVTSANIGIGLDWCRDGVHALSPPSRLDPQGGGDPAPVFEATWVIPEEYQNEAGGWTRWFPNETHVFQYKGASTKGEARVGIRTPSAGWYGGWMGPFETINPD